MTAEFLQPLMLVFRGRRASFPLGRQREQPDCPAALRQQRDDAYKNATSDASDEEPLLSGYRFVNVTAIRAMVETFLCSECHQPSLELEETSAGMSL